jgi:hypothetical protein
MRAALTMLGLAGGVAVAMFATGEDGPGETAASPKRPVTAPRVKHSTPTPQAPLRRRKHTSAAKKSVRTAAAPRVHRASRPATTLQTHRPAAITPVEPTPTSTVSTTTKPVDHHATPVVRTKPATTHAGVTTQPRPTTMTIADNFDDGVRNVSIWHVIATGTNVDVDEENGGLEIGIGAGAIPGGQYNVVDGHYGTQCKFPGDFDARVDYRLLIWPEQSGVYLALNAFFANAFVERWSQSAEEAGLDPLEVYGSWIDPRFSVVNTSDQQGSLRLRRKDGVITSYFLANGQWRKIDSARRAAEAVMGIQLSANQGVSVATTVRVAFDNFSVAAVAPVCP